MTMLLKRNTAVALTFTLADKSTGSAITSGTVSAYYSMNGATQTALAGTPSHLGNGQWTVTLLPEEVDGDTVGYLFVHSSASPVCIQAVIYDAIDANIIRALGNDAEVDGEGKLKTSIGHNGLTAASIDDTALATIIASLAKEDTLNTVKSYVDTEIGTLLSRIPQPIPFTGTRVQVSLSDVCGYDLTDSGAFNFSAFFNNGGNYSGTLFGDFSASISAITNIATQTDKLTFNVANQLYADVSAVGGNTLTSNAAFNFTALFSNGGNATYLQLEDIKGLADSYTDALAQDLEAFVSSGRGANVVTVTVRDSVAAPLQGAIVRLSEGANSFTATTNASGVATFALDNATYTRSVTKAGYVAAPDSITVTGAGNFNLSMSATGSVSAPADPSMCRVYGYLIKPDGSIASNVTVKFKLQTGGPATSGSVIATREISAATNGSGLLEVDLIRNDVITPDGSYYTISCKEVEFPHPQRLELSTPTYNLSDLV